MKNRLIEYKSLIDQNRIILKREILKAENNDRKE